MTTAILAFIACACFLLAAAAEQPSADQSAGQQQSSSTPKAQPTCYLKTQQCTRRHQAMLKQLRRTRSAKGTLTATTPQPVDFWQEHVAFSGGGMVTRDFLYDANLGVLYGYR